MSRQPNLAAAEYRKTVSAVHASPAFTDDLVSAAVRVLRLITDLADAGVFGLALDLPADVDVDADVSALDAALRKRVEAAGTPLTDDQRARRDALSDKLRDTAERARATGPSSTSLVGAASRLLFLMAPRVSPYAADLGTQVLRRLDDVADALADELDAAEVDAVPDPAVEAYHRGRAAGDVLALAARTAVPDLFLTTDGTPLPPLLIPGDVYVEGAPAGYLQVVVLGEVLREHELKPGDAEEWRTAFENEVPFALRAVDYQVDADTVTLVRLLDFRRKFLDDRLVVAEDGNGLVTGCVAIRSGASS